MNLVNEMLDKLPLIYKLIEFEEEKLIIREI
jgi:hypothetical protein